MGADPAPRDWRLVKLGELGEVNRGRSRHRPRYAEHLYGGPYPFIQTGDIKNSGGRTNTYKQAYSEAGLAQSRMWPAGTMCITIAANIAETGILGFPACFPDSVVGFIADESKCEIRFIEYTFRYLRQRIQHEASGSAQDNINLETLDRLRFLLPPLREQHAIANILGALDDKIELNRRMNLTLEAMARSLFKSWFVDFDPVRAKAEGRDPGPPRPIADLFPARLIDSELGEIPEGWPVRPLSSMCSAIFSGRTPDTTRPGYWGSNIPWLSSGETRSKFIIATEKSISPAGVSNSSTRLAHAGATVIASAGQGHTRGQASMLMLDSYINQSVVALHADTEFTSDTHLFFNLERRYEQFRQLSDAHSSRGSLTTRLLAELRIVVAPRELIHAFDGLAAASVRKICTNLEESRALASLRDALLPKLISGELRLGDTERVLAEAVA
jgi:type I restriction enzyme S subunit